MKFFAEFCFNIVPIQKKKEEQIAFNIRCTLVDTPIRAHKRRLCMYISL